MMNSSSLRFVLAAFAALSAGALTAGCANDAEGSIGASGTPIVDQCTGATLGHRDAQGNFTFANGEHVASSNVEHAEAPSSEMTSNACSDDSSVHPNMWAYKSGRCSYWGASEGGAGFWGFACKNSDGSWTVGEYAWDNASSR